MGPAEIVWRAYSTARLPLDWMRFRVPPDVPAPCRVPFSTDNYPFRLHHNGAAMESFRIFDLEFPSGFEFDWHRDYRHGQQVRTAFSGTIDIRDPRDIDIKYVWEPSRHQYLSAMSYARNSARHRSYIVRSLQSWLRANPYLSGVHWASSLELGIRVISWALIYPRVAGNVAENPTFRTQWLGAIYRHLARIAQSLSRYSSANNHLIGELVGLYVGASCFQFWPECERWRRLAQGLLEREIRLQVGEDGVNREQAMSYHLFTLELLLLAYAVDRWAGRRFSEMYAERLRAMVGFVASVATPAGDLPWYGDSDDARGFLFSEAETALETTTQLAALLFDHPAWMRFCHAPTTASVALVPELTTKCVNKGAIEPERELFPDAGLACVHGPTTQLLMDFGPLGYNSTAAHGHADALSICWAIGSEYFLVDAGTYAYHSHPEWRAYFRGTAAHNTVRIDGHDQSQMAGRFLWSARAKSRLLSFENSGAQVRIEAEHDGYTCLDDPVIHRRRVVFDRADGEVAIQDCFECARQHEVELFFHMHEDAEVLHLDDGEAEVRWRGLRIVFSSPDPAHWKVARGCTEPILGWRSRKFNEKVPAPTLRISARIDGAAILNTCLRVQL